MGLIKTDAMAHPWQAPTASERKACRQALEGLGFTAAKKGGQCMPLLANNTYWVPKEQAKTLEYYSVERLEFPLEGNEVMLGYQAGDILLNKWYELRHYIGEVEVTDDKIVFHTRAAKFGELMAEGYLYLHLHPDAHMPIGFDPIDVYLFRSHNEMIHEMMVHYADSPFVERQLGNNQASVTWDAFREAARHYREQYQQYLLF